jgi:hypothetical protein
VIFLLTVDSTLDLGLTVCYPMAVTAYHNPETCLLPLHDVSTLQSCDNPTQLYVKSVLHIILFTFSFLL